MDRLVLGRAMDSMMAAFGKPAPSDRIVEAVLSKIETAPDAFALWAADRISMEEKLPMNLAMAFRLLLPAYYATMTPRNADTEFQPRGNPDCPICHGRGSVSAWKRTDEPGVASTFIVCGCNRYLDDYPPARFGQPVWNLNQLKAAGYTLQDPYITMQREEDRRHPEKAEARKARMAHIRAIITSMKDSPGI